MAPTVEAIEVMAETVKTLNPDLELEIQTLLETYKCFICMEKIKDAHMCPHCSKLCCYSCILQWLSQSDQRARRFRRLQQKSQCPHCQVKLDVREVIKCRWVEDLFEQLGSLYNKKQNQDLRCEIHSLKQTVFCRTCKLTLCYRCALFNSSAHRDHLFQPIEEIHTEKFKEIDERCTYLKRKQNIIMEDIKELDKQINDFKLIKELKVQDLSISLKRLEKYYDGKLNILQTQKNSLINECEEIDQIIDRCNSQISRIPMAQLVKNAPECNKITIVWQYIQTLSASQLKSITIIIYFLIICLICVLIFYPI